MANVPADVLARLGDLERTSILYAIDDPPLDLWVMLASTLDGHAAVVDRARSERTRWENEFWQSIKCLRDQPEYRDDRNESKSVASPPARVESEASTPGSRSPEPLSSPDATSADQPDETTATLLGRFGSVDLSSPPIVPRFTPKVKRPASLPVAAIATDPASPPMEEMLDVDALEFPNAFATSAPPEATTTVPSVLSGVATTSSYIVGRQESRFFHEVRRAEKQGVRYPFFEGGEIGHDHSAEASPWASLTPIHPHEDSAFLEDQSRLGLLAAEPDLKVTVRPWTVAVSSSSTTHPIPPKTSFPIAWLLESDPSLVDPETGRKRLAWEAPTGGSVLVTPEAGQTAEDDLLRIESPSVPSVDGSLMEPARIPLAFLAQQLAPPPKPSPYASLLDRFSLLTRSSPRPSPRPTHTRAARSGLLDRTPTYAWEDLDRSTGQVERAKEELETKGMITVQLGPGLGAREESVRRLVDLLGGRMRDETIPRADYSAGRPLVEMELWSVPLRAFLPLPRLTRLSSLTAFVRRFSFLSPAAISPPLQAIRSSLRPPPHPRPPPGSSSTPSKPPPPSSPSNPKPSPPSVPPPSLIPLLPPLPPPPLPPQPSPSSS